MIYGLRTQLEERRDITFFLSSIGWEDELYTFELQVQMFVLYLKIFKSSHNHVGSLLQFLTSLGRIMPMPRQTQTKHLCHRHHHLREITHYTNQNSSLQFIEFTFYEDCDPTPATKRNILNNQPLVEALENASWYVTLAVLTSCTQ